MNHGLSLAVSESTPAAGMTAPGSQVLRALPVRAAARGSSVASPRLLARIAGVYYLVIFIVAPSGAATATPLRMLVTMACDTAVAIALYTLLRPVSRKLSLMALVCRLMLVGTMALGSLDYFTGLDLFHGAYSARAFNMFYALSLVPFGVHCLLIGYLIYNSRFLPRFLGVLLALAGCAYLIFASPSFADRLFPYVLIPGVLGEGLLTLWLLIAGVDSERWAAR